MCIDRYEASVWQVDVTNKKLINKIQKGSVALGDLTDAGAVQLGCALAPFELTDYPSAFPNSGNWRALEGTNPPSPGVYAVSVPGVLPSTCLTWFQAEQACALSGKRLLTNQDDLIFVVVGYLFNVHRIRVAPTLSDPQTLRLEPSMLISDQDIDRCLAALEDVCAKLRAHDAVGLTRYFIEGEERANHDMTRVTSDTKFFIYDEPPYWQRELDPPPLKVAWLFHMIDADDLISLEPDAARLSYEDRERFLRHFAPRANPMVMSSFDVQSTTGAKVRFYAIALPFTSNQMKQWLDDADFFRVRHSIDKVFH